MWLTLAVGNMLTLAALRLVQKVYLDRSNLNSFRLSWLMTAFGLPVFIAIAVANYQEISQLSVSFWIVSAVVVIGFYPTVNYLYFNTVRKNNLSDVLPLLSLVPVATLIAGWFLLGQHPTLLGTAGVLLVSIAIYMLQFNPRMHWLDPFKNLVKTDAARAMLIISIITALAAIGDKFAIDRSSTAIYLALNSIGALIVLIICDLFLNRKNIHNIKSEARNASKFSVYTMLFMGALMLATQFLGFAALSLAPVSGYAVGIRNLNLIVASVAALIVLHEPITKNKLASYGISVIGLIMIAL